MRSRNLAILAALVVSLPAFSQVLQVGDSSTPPNFKTVTVPDCDTNSGRLMFDQTTLSFTCVSVLADKLADAVTNGTTSASSNPTTTSATPVNLTSTTFVQTIANQRVICIGAGSNYSTVATTAMGISLAYGALTPGTFPVFFNNGGVHSQWSFIWTFTGEGTTGNKTVALRWHRVSGTGVLTMDSNDSYSLNCF